MKIHIINVLTIIYTIKTGFKRSNIKEMLIFENHNEVNNINNPSFNNSYRIFYNESSSFNISQLDHTYSKYKRQDNSTDDINEILKFLDFVNVSEPSIEELNKCAPVTLDYDCLNELLEYKQVFKTIDDHILEKPDEVKLNSEENLIGNLEKLVNVLKEDGKSKDPNNDVKLLSTSLKNNGDHLTFKSNILKEEKTMWNTLRTYIKDCILLNIPNSYSDKYIKRIDIIEAACDVFDNQKFDYKKYLCIFDNSFDEKIIEVLKEMIPKFNMNSDFNQKTFNIFLKEFDLKIYNSSNLNEIRSKLILLDDNQKNFIFNYEFMQLYKYVGDIPELLTLGGLNYTKYYWVIIFISHLINLLAENFENYKDNRIFILCMISKAFECFYLNQFGIFLTSVFELECNKYNHNLYYFIWEFNSQRRQNIGSRKKKVSQCTSSDKRDLKVVVLLYLYQTRIFDKYYTIDVEGIKLLKEFINKVTMNSKDCVGCIFNEYLVILPKIIINSFYL